MINQPKFFGVKQVTEPFIPKIIHQTAPKDESKWPPVWKQSQQSWKVRMPDYEYQMWTDEDLEKLIREKFPFFLDTYLSYSKNIFRIDAARPFILYANGGIYADMDYECLKHFGDMLAKDKANIVESPYKFNEHLQNSLMASPKGHPFWLVVFEELERSKHMSDILDVAGPRMISRAHNLAPQHVHVLPHGRFNPKDKNDMSVYTRHHYTVSYEGRSTWLASLRRTVVGAFGMAGGSGSS